MIRLFRQVATLRAKSAISYCLLFSFWNYVLVRVLFRNFSILIGYACFVNMTTLQCTADLYLFSMASH